MSTSNSTSILQFIGETPIIKINCFDTGPCELFVKLELQNPGGSIKDRIALTIIEEAEKSGALGVGGTIIEATAGNTGIALALVAAIKGYRIILVIPDKMSREKILHLEGLGAEVVLTRSDVPEGHQDYYHAVARRIAASTPGSFLANQFSNPANPLAHRLTTAPEIWKQMEERVDAVVCGVGSGGTVTGMAQFFREKRLDVKMVVADPKGSIVADAVTKGDFFYDGSSWLVEGIGEDFIPDNLDLSLVDDAEVVSDEEAFQTLQVLLREEGILGGSSSGTLVAGAVKWCKKQKQAKRVVTFICDTGNKYLSKAFNKSWLHDNQLLEKSCVGNLTDMISRRADKGDMISVAPTDTLNTAYNRMRSADVSQVPVLVKGRLVGILDEENLLASVSIDSLAFARTVSEYMSTHFEVLEKDASLEALRTALTSCNVAIIFDGSLFLGFITKIDLINYQRNLFLKNQG
ncbi:MAG: cystathionine beta-synthase [Cellvibrionales bacterium TMED49]|nr:cystathionine beta-synthase [Porticoccaceae bacterium]OUU39124.1 MAG: cystathionine beta-synthase [Cellvibrionales bacterium TMED49]